MQIWKEAMLTDTRRNRNVNSCHRLSIRILDLRKENISTSLKFWDVLCANMVNTPAVHGGVHSSYQF